MLNLINKNQGILALISLLATFALIVVWVTTVRADIEDIKTIQAQQIIVLRSIADSLKEKTRDHIEFKEDAEAVSLETREDRRHTNEILIKISEAIIKLDTTLTIFSGKINKLNPG